MRVNENTALVARNIVLVPYRPEHVPEYHKWMKDPEMLKLTASEPLSFEEELEMQKSWHLDDDKLTFIVLARPSQDDATDTLSDRDIPGLPMIGDVNLFFKRDIGAVEDDGETPQLEVECEVMIAGRKTNKPAMHIRILTLRSFEEPAYRRKSLGYAALSILLSYASSPEPQGLGLPRSAFLARIGASNTPSIRLFEKLGFTQSKFVEVFQEVEMRYGWGMDDEHKTDWIIPWENRHYD